MVNLITMYCDLIVLKRGHFYLGERGHFNLGLTDRSAIFAKALLDNADIVATPGNGFGEHGEGYIRFALTVDKKRIREAVERIRKRLV